MSEMNPSFRHGWAHIVADLLDKATVDGGEGHDLPDWMTKADRLALDVAYHEWNGDPEEAGVPPFPSRWSLMRFFAAKLRDAAGPVPLVPPERAAEKHAAEMDRAREEVEDAEREAADARRALTEARAKVQKLEKDGAS